MAQQIIYGQVGSCYPIHKVSGTPTLHRLASLRAICGQPPLARFLPHPSVSSFLNRCHLASSSRIASSSQEIETSHEIADDDDDFVVVNFYHLVDIARPHAVIQHHLEYMEDKDVRGRIYISEQGVNAQFGGRRRDAVGYAEWLRTTQTLFAGLLYSVDVVDDHMFPKLRLKYKPNLISLAGGMQTLPITDPKARATPLHPSEWRQFLAQGVQGRKPLVLDVRNGYEWDAGHFVGAERPAEDEFNQTPTEATPVEVPPALQNADPDIPVMMYCTGGIRCDVYSTYLKKKGYTNLYTLEGGIQNYMKQEGLDHWNGSLFVFDGRMAIRPNKDEAAPLEAASPCAICGGTAVLPHANCANIDCNKLFIACNECKGHYRGCCCESCMDAPRLLRPVKEKGQYGNWMTYASDEDAQQVMKEGRGEGRISRRRRRQQDLKKREEAKRAVKLERRRYAKEEMEKVMASREKHGEEEEGDRIARLRELRSRLATSKNTVVVS